MRIPIEYPMQVIGGGLQHVLPNRWLGVNESRSIADEYSSSYVTLPRSIREDGGSAIDLGTFEDRFRRAWPGLASKL